MIYLAALKKGAIRHTHPLFAVYRKLPPPPSHEAFSSVRVNYVQQSALNERCRIMIIYSTAKRQKNQNDRSGVGRGT